MPKANLIEFGHHFTIKKSRYLLEKRGAVAHVAGRLRIIIISHHLTGVSSSLSRVTLETSLVLLAGGQGFFFSRITCFAPPDATQNERNNLDGT